VTDAQPTAQDIANAERRRLIASRLQAEYDQAVAWATEVFGPGWSPRGRHSLVDKAEETRARKAGDKMQAAATVYDARNDQGETRHFKLVDGRPVECADYKEGFAAMLFEPHPTLGFVDQTGKWHAYHRFSLYWAGFELYEPRSAESLAASRVKREERKIEKQAEEFPLFAVQIRAGDLRPEKRSSGRT